MEKNVVFMTCFEQAPDFLDYKEWCYKTWSWWCKKHNVLFVPFEEPIESDLVKFRINWQKAIFCFDELDRRGIDYDQIYLVDGMNMIKWDAPNIFELTGHKFTAWRDTDNLNWIHTSIQGYKEFFNNYELDIIKYFSSGLIIFNESHKELFNSFKKLYYDNVDMFVKLQDEIVRKGTEQTPLNYWLQSHDCEINTDIPFTWKLTHLHRKEMFNHNWQLKEDPPPVFIKYGNIWNFSGLPKDKRTEIMTQVWNLVKHNYDEEHLLNTLIHKDEWVKTTQHDAGHTARQIIIDIERLIKINPNIILIFDDYGQPDRVIANTLQEFINKSNFQISQYIGEYNGFTCKNGKITFATREGVILTAQKQIKYEKEYSIYSRCQVTR